MRGPSTQSPSGSITEAMQRRLRVEAEGCHRYCRSKQMSGHGGRPNYCGSQVGRCSIHTTPRLPPLYFKTRSLIQPAEPLSSAHLICKLGSCTPGKSMLQTIENQKRENREKRIIPQRRIKPVTSKSMSS